MSPHRIEQLLAQVEREHRLARRRQLRMYVLFFLAVMGLAYLYTQVRDLSRENQHRLQENRVALQRIDQSRRVNQVCPDLQDVKKLLRASVSEQYAEIKKPGTLQAYVKVYGDARGRRLFKKQLHDLPVYLKRLKPQRCTTPQLSGQP